MKYVKMLAAAMGCGACVPTCLAINELADPSFELPVPIQLSSSVPTNLLLSHGQWGSQNGVKVGGFFGGQTDGIVPFDGVVMDRMVSTGDVSGITRTYQALDLTPYHSLIDSGQATIEGSERFNAPFAGAVAIMSIEYFDGSGFYDAGHQTGLPSMGSLGLDSDLANWDILTVGASVPVNTRWVLFSVGFQNASLGSGAGYADFNNVSIGPTPGTAGLLGLGALVGLRRRR